MASPEDVCLTYMESLETLEGSGSIWGRHRAGSSGLGRTGNITLVQILKLDNITLALTRLEISDNCSSC